MVRPEKNLDYFPPAPRPLFAIGVSVAGLIGLALMALHPSSLAAQTNYLRSGDSNGASSPIQYSAPELLGLGSQPATAGAPPVVQQLAPAQDLRTAPAGPSRLAGGAGFTPSPDDLNWNGNALTTREMAAEAAHSPTARAPAPRTEFGETRDHLPSGSPPARIDPLVDLANFEQSLSGPGQPRKSLSGFDDVQLRDTIKKIGINTGIALLVGVALILVAKRRGMVATGSPQAAAGRVQQTIPLGNKSLLKIVQVGPQQVLIALDSAGIKSVIPLDAGFAEALARVEDEPEEAPAVDTILERLERSRRLG